MHIVNLFFTSPVFVTGLCFLLIVPGACGQNTVVSADYYTNDLGMRFVLIEVGMFMMGASELDGLADQMPSHRIRITRPFYMGQYEVTQEQWKTVMETNPSDFKGENRPVENVSWHDVQVFIRKLNAREGGEYYRLPTEAEWEYAAKAGTED